MHGRGTYLFADGGTYEGEFEFGKAEGNGIASYPSGQSYTGTWSKGRYDGKGTTLFLGESCYSGEFSFGRRHGKGKLTFNSGLEYEGSNLVQHRRFFLSYLTNFFYQESFWTANRTEEVL